MRVSKHQAAENREAIVRAAAALFRAHGFNGVGIDEIMAEAGLTHGGFYRNFASKDDLAAHAVAHAAQTSARRQSSHAGLKSYLKTYLSKAHRDDPATGCFLAALGPEIARAGDGAGQGARHEAAKSIRAQIETIAGWIAAPTAAARRRKAIATLSAMVGAMMLSRTVDDPKLSDEILEATRKVLF